VQKRAAACGPFPWPRAHAASGVACARFNGKSVTWSADGFAKQIERLPQIFWNGGEPWSEANHWALSKAVGRVGRDMKTVAIHTNLLHSID